MPHDFTLTLPPGATLQTHQLTQAFLDKGISSFGEACAYIKQLPYKRPFGKTPRALLQEECGTCSGKHGVLKALAIEQQQHDVQLVLCLFMMDASNTPAIKDVILAGPLTQIPEAHTYLRLNDMAIDVTGGGVHVDKFRKDVMLEQVASMDTLAQKTAWHRQQLAEYLKDNHPSIALEAAWNQREMAIAALSKSTNC